MLANFVEAQQKYAVLICGEPVEASLGDSNGMFDYTGTTGFYHWTEFWAETYNTWEMLIKPVDSGGKGFRDENVYVLYAGGEDFKPYWIADKYNAEINYFQYFPIVDYSATKENVEMVFNGLASGQGDFPLLTEEDFLFVWTFGHGGICGENQQFPCLRLYYNEEIKNYEFAELINAIPAHNLVFMPDGNLSETEK